MNYRVIGDIHGRSDWKRLVNPSEECIFLGDYFDPYEDISFEECMNNMREILQYKREHLENTVLLLGNHDTQYLCGDRESCTRRMVGHEQEIEAIFRENRELFTGVIYSIHDEIAVSHAGVSLEWAQKMGLGRGFMTKRFAEAVNQRFWEGFDKGGNDWEGFDSFCLIKNRTGDDRCGQSLNDSPIWIRPISLYLANIPGGSYVEQIIGHSKRLVPKVFEGIAYADCLEDTVGYIAVDKDCNVKPVILEQKKGI